MATRAGRVLVGSIVEGVASTRTTHEAETAAIEWAQAGIPLAAVHKHLTDGVVHAYRLDSCAATDSGLPDAVVETLTSVLATISTAYLTELGDRQSPRQRLISALLDGEDPTGLSRECGIAVAPSYAVVAVAFPLRGRKGPLRPTARTRVTLELERRTGRTALARLSDQGGTLLIPSPVDEAILDRILTRLSSAAGVGLTAATTSATPGAIGDAVRRAHELLDLALVFGRIGKLYRLADLAVEYQLTRPGPARDQLAAVLAPIEHAPHLMQTLRLHLPGVLSRQAIAHRLNIHVNTVDYRLKRVAVLTGFDPLIPSGQWTLWSAVIARSQAGLLTVAR
ncbi:helix-turn-helix domain-containing protein [Nocardia sp. CA2R105]|uniref:PucR family transcriptional regulator n=1 Tax=Nocardia coffeae TaxID=2873381 RepID=UPI001CA5F9CC|nr:helix-turn-helix domain-containing protein [Nocardia coffeae]MBY8859225.1 helix-turn-helix domain-containing protein [Nocardia coffeae]